MFTVNDRSRTRARAGRPSPLCADLARTASRTSSGYAVLHEGLRRRHRRSAASQEITYAEIEKETQRRPGTLERRRAAGSASPTNIGPPAVMPGPGLRRSRARFSGQRHRPAEDLPDRLARRRAQTIAPGRHGRRHDARLRRRQGSRHDRRLRGRARHQELRPDDRLGLVLFHHQAAVQADRRIYKFVGNFGSPSSSSPCSSRLAFFPLANRSPTLSMAKMKAVQPQMQALQGALSRRQGEAAAGA